MGIVGVGKFSQKLSEVLLSLSVRWWKLNPRDEFGSLESLTLLVNTSIRRREGVKMTGN